jgi:azurin
MNKLILFALCGSLFLSACNNADNAGSNNNSATEAVYDGTDGTIVLKAGDDMKFNLKELKAKAGQSIQLRLQHTGKAGKGVMGHNFVLLKEGASLDAFVSRAIKAAENDYVPSADPDVMVHTKMLGGGESDDITFVVPAAGRYPFLCSFPGHAMAMNGLLIVE